jgi:diguanylate cyclase (GGDEF)-like protein
MANEPSEAPADTWRILVAEDEEIIREMLFSYLTEEGYIVDTAATGDQAVARAREQAYHVVITDIRLPGANGMEVLRAAKETAPETEVIVMTAFSTEDLAIEAVRLGAYDYLKKPVDDLGLFALLIRQILQKQALRQENQRLVEDLQSRNQQLHDANARLVSMATTDPLTGVYNRRYILARLEQQFTESKRYGEPFAVVMADLDHFKAINDRFGHQVGDEVLRHVVGTIRRMIRSSDLFGRYGGEEFLLILQRAEPEVALRTADRLRAEVRDCPCRIAGEVIPVTVSMGLMHYPSQGADSAEDVVRAADAALYRAKAEGRDRVVMASAPAAAGA